MVSQATEPSPGAGERGEKARAGDSAADWQRANRGGLRRLVASTVRLADLQLRIWVTEAKITVARVLIFVVLYTVAGVMALLGTIFLFIGVFRILTDVIGIPTVWSFLILSLLTFGAAGTVMLIAQKMLAKKAGQGERKNENKQADKAR